MRIAIASGKGGTGKTFISTNLFRLMDSLGMDVVLADCDAEVPNDSIFLKMNRTEEHLVKSFIPSINEDKCVYCSACADLCHFHAITCIPSVSYIKLMDDNCHGCHACEYVCKEGAIETSWKNRGKVSVYERNGQPKLVEGKVNVKQNSPVPVIQETIQRAINTGATHILLDAPPGCSCPFVHSVLLSDFVLLVTEPTPFGLSDLKQTIEVLNSLNVKFGVIINRADLGFSDMSKYLEAENIEILAQIPYDEEIAKLYAEGNLPIDYLTHIKEVFETILTQILNYENSYC